VDLRPQLRLRQDQRRLPKLMSGRAWGQATTERPSCASHALAATIHVPIREPPDHPCATLQPAFEPSPRAVSWPLGFARVVVALRPGASAPRRSTLAPSALASHRSSAEKSAEEEPIVFLRCIGSTRPTQAAPSSD
jgi:hypothetical protein